MYTKCHKIAKRTECFLCGAVKTDLLADMPQ